MSNLSGYDSEAVGFDSVTSNKRSENTSSTQTSEFAESGIGCQTSSSKDYGCGVTPEELDAHKPISEYPAGLNQFLKRVVPAMLEQLDQKDNKEVYNSSDSDEEEVVTAKLLQEIQANNDTPRGAGDYQTSTVLDLSFSSAGNSLAVSVGKAQHEQWCEHDGLIRIYTVKRAANDNFVHSMDITEKNCVTVVKYHPNAPLLAYGTTSGEVVLYSAKNSTVGDHIQLTSPVGCHGSKRVSFLMWADSTLANTYLTMHIVNSGKRRTASDQVLISSGSDGTVNVWQVNSDPQKFENIICYNINGSRKMMPPDISCFDFVKTFPLRPWDEKVSDDIFVVGTKVGKLYLCKIKSFEQIVDSTMVDPVCEELEGHKSCVLSVAFSPQKPGVFVSMSMDSELRLYHVDQLSPLKILCLDVPVACAAWLPGGACVVCGALGADATVWDVARHSAQAVLRGEALCVAVTHAGSQRVAAGDAGGCVRVWELPARKRIAEDLLF